ncbi:MAG: methyltransferase domain-containing protein [Candidatus Competibacteraceae bacterium]|nr:methyltransferase domain-containing protein [Candidatus Competibacteraceae bacterium]
MASERGFFENLPQIFFEVVDGYDLSPESIQRFHTDKFIFNPHIQDVDCIILPSKRFDLVVGSHGIHHIFNLGGLFYQTHKSLKPNGLFVLNEWIGPCYLQIPLRNHVLAALLLVIFVNFRKPVKIMKVALKAYGLILPTAFDPSEACNSDELMPQLLKYF